MSQTNDFDAELQQYTEALKSRMLKDFKCPVCGEDKFAVVAGYFRHSIQQDKNSIAIGGPGVDTIMLICDHCGYILEFAANILAAKPGE